MERVCQFFSYFPLLTPLSTKPSTDNMKETYILFSLENCVKCTMTKKLLSTRDDINYIELPHDMKEWSEAQQAQIEAYDVFHDLRVTAPILVSTLTDKKHIGYLQIKKLFSD